LDMTLQLPVLGSARPIDTQGQEGLLVLNIDAQGRLKLYGIEKDVGAYIAEEARAAIRELERNGQKFQPGDELPTTDVIRANRRTPFSLLNNVIQTCQSHGFRKFSLKAMNRVEGTPRAAAADAIAVQRETSN